MTKKKSQDFLIPTVLSAFFLGCLSSCATNGRLPSSEKVLSLEQIIDEVRLTSERQKSDPSSCRPRYDELYQRLFNLAGDTTYIDLNDLKTIDRDIKTSFAARLALKETFKDFKGDGDCLKSASDVFRGLRYVEDYLIEIHMEKTADMPVEYVNLQGEFPYLMVNPKFVGDFKSSADMKSGDIILSRGNAFSSAAIARIGNNDYQFSHLSFVHKDDESGELSTTEAHIEIGSIVAPLSEHISSKNSREVVFRYNGDPLIAKKASDYIYDYVLDAQTKKKVIEYDFSMDFKENEKLFCSEIVSSGFKYALPDEDYFPMFKSKFTLGIIPFLNTIGIPANKDNIDTLEVFAPGDIQFDPRFDLVAEWRNPRKLEESRIKDFILTKMFERMDVEGYKVDPSFVMDAQAKTFWLLRRLPIVRKFLQNKIPLGMKPGQIELFMALDKIGDSIYKEVEKSSLEYERPMTPKEIYGVLDAYFKRDFELYKRYKKGNNEDEIIRPSFHLLFHP